MSSPPSLFIVVSLVLTTSCGLKKSGHPEVRPSPEDSSRWAYSNKKSKKLCIFMDGTLNDSASQTHVRRLYELVSSKYDPRIICYYDTGVGTDGKFLSGSIGGQGFQKNMAEAYAFLGANYKPGDKIYLFGFSRGARQAQVLTDIIDKRGLKKYGRVARKGVSREDIKSALQIIKDYTKIQYAAKRDGTEANFAKKEGPNTTVEFVGIWDSVETLGNNIFSRRRYTKPKQDRDYIDHYAYSYSLPENVNRAYHAMALDEKRGLYNIIKWRNTHTNKKTKVEQVWFAGSHGDIGGGYIQTQSLSGISFNWMTSKLRKDAILPSNQFTVQADYQGASRDMTQDWLTGFLLGKLKPNSIRKYDFWSDRINNKQTQNVSTAVNPQEPILIHKSVLARMKAGRLPEYPYYLKKSTRDDWHHYRPSMFDVKIPSSLLNYERDFNTAFSQNPETFTTLLAANGVKVVGFEDSRSNSIVPRSQKKAQALSATQFDRIQRDLSKDNKER